MIADLHFHPSYFNARVGFQLTQWTVPTLKEIVDKAREKNVSILTITSGSNYKRTDARWEDYRYELQLHSGLKGYDHYAFGDALEVCYKTTGTKIYIFHGQELETDRGDINVLFAEKRIGIKGSRGKFNYIIDAAKDSGDDVLIGINCPTRFKSKEDILQLYIEGKIHFLETHNAMETKKNNRRAKKMIEGTEYSVIPRIAVSDGHRLEDMAIAYTKFNFSFNGSSEELKKIISYAIKNKEFSTHEGECGYLSKFLCFARMAEATIKLMK